MICSRCLCLWYSCFIDWLFNSSLSFSRSYILFSQTLQHILIKIIVYFYVYLQNHLKQLVFNQDVHVNYTGSWLKTVVWLQWLSLLIANTYKTGRNILVKNTVLDLSYNYLWVVSHGVFGYCLSKSQDVYLHFIVK